MKISGIYKIQSIKKPNRCYIGSSVNVGYRWVSHLTQLKKGTHHSPKLQNHFNKYGESDLQFSVLLGCSKEDLIKIEQYFIDTYKCYFNCSPTAGSPLGVKHTDESRKNMSEAHKGQIAWNKGKKSSNETRKKLSISHKGKISSRKGKYSTEETKLKLSISHIGIKPSEESLKKRSETMKKVWELRKATPEFEALRKKLSDIAKNDWARRKLNIICEN